VAFTWIQTVISSFQFLILLFTADSMSHLLLTFFSVYVASPPPHPHFLLTSDRVFQFIFLFVNQITGRENKQRVVKRMMIVLPIASESVIFILEKY
jgi:hypothetical protein